MTSRVRTLALAAASTLALAGCVGMPTEGPPIPITGRTLLDDYVVAHGFAAGCVLSRDADRPTVLTIVKLDHAALLALSESAAHPTDALAAAQAQNAIRMLTTFVAQSSVDGQRS